MPERILAACAALVALACSSEPAAPARWTQQLGTAAHDYGQAVATDADGNVLLGGTTYGPIDGLVPDPQFAGQPHAFVAKYDAAGAVRWIRELGDAWVGDGRAVATDAAGNVFLAGTLFAAAATGDCADAFLAKYDAGGALRWVRTHGTRWCDEFDGVASDAAGNVYAAGLTNGTFSIDQPPNGGDGFLVKYDADGTEQWTRSIGGGWAWAVAAESAGAVFVGGSTWVGLDGNAPAGDLDAFVAKYGADGARLWTRQLGTPAEDYGRSVAVDRAGNVILGGATTGGPAPVGWDPFVAKFGTDGTWLWTRQLGTPAYDMGRAVATDAAGNVFLAGVMHGIRDPLDGIHSSNGDLDAFVVSYAADGAWRWVGVVGGAGAEDGRAVATDAAGNVFLAGDTLETFDGNRSHGYYDAFVASFDAAGHER